MWQEMNDKIAQRIMLFLGTEQLGDEVMTAKVQYALQVILDELQKFVVLSLLFGLFYQVGKFYLAFLALGSLRIFMGGSHRSTKAGCLLSSLVNFGMILCFSAFLYMPISVAVVVVFLLVLEILFWVPLTSPQQLRYSTRQKKRLKKKALAALVTWGCVVPFLPAEAGNIVFWSLAFQAAEVLTVVLYRGSRVTVKYQS